MPDPLLPKSVPIAIASLIAGLSDRTFREQAIKSGLVETDDRGRVVLASLESHIGKTITAEVYLRAERKRDKARERQARYRDAQKG